MIQRSVSLCGVLVKPIELLPLGTELNIPHFATVTAATTSFFNLICVCVCVCVCVCNFSPAKMGREQILNLCLFLFSPLFGGWGGGGVGEGLLAC